MKNRPANVLFVILPYIVQSNYKMLIYVSYPYGCLSTATYLQKNAKDNPKINILNLNLYSQEDIPEVTHEHLKILQPDIVGISMFFDESYKNLWWISKQVKDYNCSPWGAICYSEGESVMPSLVEIENPSEMLLIELALVTKKSLAENRIPKPRYVNNLNDIIDINYDLLDVKLYGMKEMFSPFTLNNSDVMRQFWREKWMNL